MRDYDQLIAGCEPAYREWLSDTPDDFLAENDLAVLYCRESIPERNETNEMEEYLPNHLIIGDDSGDYVFVISSRKEGPVCQVDAGSLSEDDFEELAPTFQDWMGAGFPLPEEEPLDLPLNANIYVNGVPDVKTLYEIRRMVGATWAAGNLGKMLTTQPFCAVESGHPVALRQALSTTHGNLAPYFFVSDGKALKPVFSP